MATLDNGSIVRGAYEAWNAKDLDRAASFAASDARITSVPFGTKLSYREYIENWATAFPDGQIDVQNLVAQGDCVIAEFTGRGTHTGVLKAPTGDVSPTGRRAELGFVEVYRIRNGKIAEGRMYFDAATMMRQLGIGAAAQAASTTARETTTTAQRH